MKEVAITASVSDTVTQIKDTLAAKGFTLFCEIDHQANAASVDLTLAESIVLIFGNPVAGTKLMQKDIRASFDLPMRVAVFDNAGQTYLVHQTSQDYAEQYQVADHPVLEKIDALFASLVAQLTA